MLQIFLCSAILATALAVDRQSFTTCRAQGRSGFCTSTNSCVRVYKRVPVPDYCPGQPSDVQCCIRPWPCNADGNSGSCQIINDCIIARKIAIPGHCAGASNVQCCINKPACRVGASTGRCEYTWRCSRDGGRYFSGHCPGPGYIQCCIT